jgi:hypothetical protein
MIIKVTDYNETTNEISLLINGDRIGMPFHTAPEVVQAFYQELTSEDGASSPVILIGWKYTTPDHWDSQPAALLYSADWDDFS